MSASFNQVTLVGNLTREIQLRAAGQSQVGDFGLAINRRYKNAAGEAREDVTFVDVETWGKTAENCAQYISKGSAVLVVGRLKMDSWDDKTTGEKRYKLKVVAEQVQFLGGKKDGEGATSAATRAQPF
jgi:single-strand DNA-binding protein